jgi:hypothetical protein
VRLEVVDVVGAVSWIISKGCDRVHRIKDGHLFDLALNCPLDPRDIHIDAALHLESRPNAGDASDVYAILDQTTHGKGLLIDIFDEICDRGLAERLVENRNTEFVEDRDGPLRPTQGLQERVRPRSRALCIAHRIYGLSGMPLWGVVFGARLRYGRADICLARHKRDSRLNRIPISSAEVPDTEMRCSGGGRNRCSGSFSARPIARNEVPQGGNDGQEHHQRDDAFA